MVSRMFLDYAGIRVTDLDRSLRFYTDSLGLQEVRRGTMFHGGLWVLLEDPVSKQRLELNWYPPGHVFATEYSVGEGLDHLGFRLPEVLPMVEKLLDAGATLVMEPWAEKGVVEVAFLRDPDGIWIELIRLEG